MKRVLCGSVALLLCLASVLSFVSCGRTVSPADALASFSSSYPMPAGKLYDSEAEEGSDRFVPPGLFPALFARAKDGDDREDVTRYALFLGSSLTNIAEMGILECPDRDCAREVTDRVRERIATLAAFPFADTSAVSDAKILLFGSTVVYCVLPDNEKAARVLERIF